MRAVSATRKHSPVLSFPTKLACILTVASLLLLVGLRLGFSPEQAAATTNAIGLSRRLDQQQDDNAGDDKGDDDSNAPADYNSYSCDLLYDTTPDPGDAQCLFAKTCNDGDGVWAPFVFCSKHSTKFLSSLIAPVIILWMVLLFRILGSTAEDYFSPALEMFSVKLGLRKSSKQTTW